MSLRTLRRRFGEFTAAHDWLEGASVVLGLMFFVFAALCIWAILVGITSWGEAAPAFEAGENQPTIGFLNITRGFGIVLYSFLAFLTLGVGWFLAGDWIRRRFRRSG